MATMPPTSSDGLKAPSGACIIWLCRREKRVVARDVGRFWYLAVVGRRALGETDLVYAPESRLYHQDRWVEHCCFR